MSRLNGHTLNRHPKGKHGGIIDPIMLNRMSQHVENAFLGQRQFFADLADPRRSVEVEAGYPEMEQDIDVQLFRQLYDREAIATRVVQCMPYESWIVQPIIHENADSDEPTEFEQAVDDLARTQSGVGKSWYKDDKGSPVWEMLRRADVLSGIGKFGIILLGIDDGRNLQEPVDGIIALNGYHDCPVIDERQAQARLDRGEFPFQHDDPLMRSYQVNKVSYRWEEQQGKTPFERRPPKLVEERTPMTVNYRPSAYEQRTTQNMRRMVINLAKGVTPEPVKNAVQVPRQLQVAAQRMLKIPGAMPGYGQLYWAPSSKEVWYVGGDGDEPQFCKAVKSLLSKVKGVKRVTYEAEAFPDQDSGEWVHVNPTKETRTDNSATMQDWLTGNAGKGKQSPRKPSQRQPNSEPGGMVGQGGPKSSYGDPSGGMPFSSAPLPTDQMASSGRAVGGGSIMGTDTQYAAGEGLPRAGSLTGGKQYAAGGTPGDPTADDAVRKGFQHSLVDSAGIALPQGSMEAAGRDNSWSQPTGTKAQVEAAARQGGGAYDPYRSQVDIDRKQDELADQLQDPNAEAVSGGIGMPPAALSGTDQQYFGVQYGPSEGFMDKKVLKGGRKLVYMRAYSEDLVQVVRYEWNIFNPRFGQPVMYRVTLNDPRDTHSGVGLPMATVFVHWSRVIHLADNRNSSEVFGAPRMRPVLNNILGLHKLYCGDPEMYWKAAFPGLSFETHPQLGGDVLIDTAQLDQMMNEYWNSLRRGLVTSGMTVKNMSPTVADVSPHVAVQIEATCIQLNIPVPVFKGYEIGEQASENNDEKWLDVVRSRQVMYLTPRVVVTFIDRLIQLGVLPEPEGYSVEWPKMDSQTATDKAAIAMQTTQALAAYVQGGVEQKYPFLDYLIDVWGYDEEKAQAICDEAEKQADAHQDDMDKAGVDVEPTPMPGFQKTPPPPPKVVMPNGQPVPGGAGGGAAPPPSKVGAGAKAAGFALPVSGKMGGGQKPPQAK